MARNQGIKKNSTFAPVKDFAAIDFETANECRTSVCSVGVVVVRNGEIAEKFYSLIRPEPDYYRWFCIKVHGLCDDDTRDARCFPMCGDESNR